MASTTTTALRQQRAARPRAAGGPNGAQPPVPPPPGPGPTPKPTPASEPVISVDRYVREVGGPVSSAWREGTLTRAKELESLCAWLAVDRTGERSQILADAVRFHVEAARQAARGQAPDPRQRLRLLRGASLRERAMSNLDAAEAQLLNLAHPRYVLGQLPSLLQHARCHLVPSDSRRVELERIAQRLGVNDPSHPLMNDADESRQRKRLAIVEQEQSQIVAAMRAASSAALREQVRLRSFRNILVATTFIMTAIAIGVAVLGFRNPALVPLCFAPEEAGQAVVVCPTQQSAPFSTARLDANPPASSTDIDDFVMKAAQPWDLLIVELIGMTAAAVAAAAAIRGIRGSSERYGLPVALAALKLPTGAVTAVLGLLLMRGQFVPGLSALDSSAQVLAWALVFGYAQQLFTRLVDRQGQAVLDSVKGASKAPTATVP